MDPIGIVSLEKEGKLGGEAAIEGSSASVTQEGSQMERSGPIQDSFQRQRDRAGSWMDTWAGEESHSGLSTGLD